jgi:hypothetical protein
VNDDDDNIPAGYAPNTAVDNRRLAAATARVAKELGDCVRAVAMVFLLPDGKVTASLAAEDLDALAQLAAKAPGTLTVTIERLLRGKGTTTLIVDGKPKPPTPAKDRH